MKKSMIVTVALVAFAHGAAAQVYSNAQASGLSNAPIGLESGTSTLSGVVSPAGFVWSELQPDPALAFYNQIAGFAGSGAFRCADDFVVPSGETWTLTDIKFYAYVTGSAPGTNPYTAWTLAIHENTPTGPVVFGDTTTNVMGPVTNTNIYRIFNTSPGTTAPGTTRLVREVTINAVAGKVLTAGTYVLNFANSAGFVPTLVKKGERTQAGWNGQQFNAAWAPVLDTGLPAGGPAVQQDFAFIINYTKDSDCYPDCDGDGALSIDDFICFQTFFALGDPYADCDDDGALSIDDFICFQTFFAIGC